MLTGYRFGFHAVRSHRGHLLGQGAFVMPRALQRCITPPSALSYWLVFFIATPDTP